MQRNCPSIYLEARNFSGLGRQGAADKLHISESSLKCYEAGAKVPDEVALDMATTYKTPWLRAQHLSKNLVFQDLFGARLDIKPTSSSVLVMQKELEDVKQRMPAIIEKAINGKGFGCDILKDCREAAAAIMTLFCREKEETAGAVTPTVSRLSKI